MVKLSPEVLIELLDHKVESQVLDVGDHDDPDVRVLEQVLKLRGESRNQRLATIDLVFEELEDKVRVRFVVEVLDELVVFRLQVDLLEVELQDKLQAQTLRVDAAGVEDVVENLERKRFAGPTFSQKYGPVVPAHPHRRPVNKVDHFSGEEVEGVVYESEVNFWRLEGPGLQALHLPPLDLKGFETQRTDLVILLVVLASSEGVLLQEDQLVLGLAIVRDIRQ